MIGRERGIKKSDREKRNKHRAVTIWLTGLPCSGKTTIAYEVEKKLFKMNFQVVALDGDTVRQGLNRDLGFSAEDRCENIRRVGEVAKLFTEAGFIVITAFISPYQEDRNKVRALFKHRDFIEVYIKAAIETCKKRDVKGLYRKALEGKIFNFTGISAPYEEPVDPEIVLDTDKLPIEESVNKILDHLTFRK